MVLRIPTFGVLDMDTFSARALELLESLDATAPLIIDVRGNEGGLRENAIAVINHLVDTDYTQWTEVTARIERIPSTHADFIGFTFGDESALRLPSSDAEGPRYDGDPLAPMMTPAVPHLGGRVVLVVAVLPGSAANSFVFALVAHRDDVVVVGEELGGECQQHNGQIPILYRTPISDLTISISLFRIRHIPVAGCEWARGLRPDVPVTVGVDAVRNRRDPFMSAAIMAATTIQQTAVQQ